AKGACENEMLVRRKVAETVMLKAVREQLQLSRTPPLPGRAGGSRGSQALRPHSGDGPHQGCALWRRLTNNDACSEKAAGMEPRQESRERWKALKAPSRVRNSGRHTQRPRGGHLLPEGPSRHRAADRA